MGCGSSSPDTAEEAKPGRSSPPPEARPEPEKNTNDEPPTEAGASAATPSAATAATELPPLKPPRSSSSHLSQADAPALSPDADVHPTFAGPEDAGGSQQQQQQQQEQQQHKPQQQWEQQQHVLAVKLTGAEAPAGSPRVSDAAKAAEHPDKQSATDATASPERGEHPATDHNAGGGNGGKDGGNGGNGGRGAKQTTEEFAARPQTAGLLSTQQGILGLSEALHEPATSDKLASDEFVTLRVELGTVTGVARTFQGRPVGHVRAARTATIYELHVQIRSEILKTKRATQLVDLDPDSTVDGSDLNDGAVVQLMFDDEDPRNRDEEDDDGVTDDFIFVDLPQ